jgi:hypothetical protein
MEDERMRSVREEPRSVVTVGYGKEWELTP